MLTRRCFRVREMLLDESQASWTSGPQECRRHNALAECQLSHGTGQVWVDQHMPIVSRETPDGVGVVHAEAQFIHIAW
jgi:hypothetical protein